jgi:hypothetical protein
MYALQQPDKNSHNDLYTMLSRARGGYGMLGGMDFLWKPNEGTDYDFFALESRNGLDAFTKWLICHLFPWSLRRKVPLVQNTMNTDDEINGLDSDAIHRTIRFCSSVIASIIPVLAAISLFYVSSLRLRLYLMMLSTLVLAAAMNLLTKATQSEVYLATNACVPSPYRAVRI